MYKHFKMINRLSQNIMGMQPRMVEEEITSETLPMQKQGNQFVIEKGLSIPLKRVKYDLQVELIATIGRLEKGDSFLVKVELKYPVQTLKERHFPQYRLRFRLIGEEYRVFRVA